MKVAVLGSGAGAFAIAADLSRAGRETVLADLPEFASNLDPVRERGGVRVNSGWYGPHVEAVAVTEVSEAVTGADLVVVSVPCFGHEPWIEVLTPLLADGQPVLFMGEGSGAVVARLALDRAGRNGVVVGETNTLPYIAVPGGPGAVNADRKDGGTFLAAVPATHTERLLDLISDVWPYVSAAGSVWETVLINYNAIDHVATMLANAGTLQNRTGGMLLWGEGASPAVVRVIEAVDGELLAVRRALGLSEERRYRDLLIAQGFAPDAGPGLYEVLRSSRLIRSFTPTGPEGLETRYITEDIPFSLVLESSIAREVGVPTPVIDGLIAIGSAMLARDFRAEGRTLEALGLAGVGAEGLRRFAETGEVMA